MKNYCLTLFIVFVLILAGCSSTTDDDDKDPRLDLRKSQATELVNGDTLTVELKVTNAKDMFGIAANISYDSEILDFIDGSFLTGNFWGNDDLVEHFIVENDTIQFAVSLKNTSKIAGLNGEGTLCTFSFVVNSWVGVNTEIIYSSGYILNSEGELQDNYTSPKPLSIAIEEDPDYGDFPDIPATDDWMWSDFGYQYVMILEYDSYEKGYVEIYGESYEEPIDFSLQIQGETLEDVYFDYDDNVWTFETYYYSSEINPGSNISYAVMINDTNYSGMLQVPYEINASFPSYLDFEEDLSFTWSLSQNPDLQYCFLWFEYMDSFEEWQYVYENWRLDADVRSHTINKSIYSGLSFYNFWLDVDINAVNYDVENAGLIFAYSYASKGYYDYKTDNPVRNKRNLLKRWIKDIQK